MTTRSSNLISMTHSRTMHRRRFLQLLAAGSAASMSVPNLASAAIRTKHVPRALAFHNLHTGEKVSLTYFEQGRYISGALQEINTVLRDHRSGDIHPMDPNLLNMLHNLQTSLAVKKPFNVISGYRSPASNAKLRSKSHGVAKKSKHMQGKAIDIRIEGIDTSIVRDAAIAMQQGGVGYYSSSDFLHLDTGSFRTW